MAFYLGSFSSGLFSGASNVAQLYGMYQGISQMGKEQAAADLLNQSNEMDRVNANVPGYVARQGPTGQDMSGMKTGGSEYPLPGPETPGYSSSTAPATKPAQAPPNIQRLAGGGPAQLGRERQGYDTPPSQLAGDYPLPGPGTFPAQTAAKPPGTEVSPGSSLVRPGMQQAGNWLTDQWGRLIGPPGTQPPAQPQPPSQIASQPPIQATPAVDDFGRPIPQSTARSAAPATQPAAPAQAAAPSGPVVSQPTPQRGAPQPPQYQLPPGLTPPLVPFALPAQPNAPGENLGQTNVAPPDQYTVQTPAEAQTGTSALTRPSYPPTPPPVPTTDASTMPAPPPNPVAAGQTGIQPIIRSLTPAEPAGPPEAPVPGAPMGPVSQAPPSPMRRVLDALNPISSAQAAEPPAGAVMAKRDEGTGTGTGTGTPAPGTTTATPAPASSTTQPAQQQTQPGPLAVQGKPGQVQSESTPAVAKPLVRTNALERVLKEQPALGQRIIQIAEEHKISPFRLALHWELENGLKEQWQTGADGELGMMQIMPATWRNADPKSQYDPRTTDGALHVASLVIWDADGKFGKDSPSSVLAYQQGPAGAGHAATYGVPPRGTAYLQRAYPGMDIAKLGLTELKEPNAGAIVRAADGGPDAVLREIVNSAPRNMSMTDIWRRAENALMYAAASKGDYQGLQHAQEFIFQQSHQGAMSNLMAAHQSLMAGDVTSAAQMLAKAHAFFPDGSYGRFGVGPDGKLYGEQYSETTGKRIGTRIQITPEALQYQLMSTFKPADYVKSVQEQLKINETSAYHRDLIAKELLGIGERSRTATLDREQREGASVRTSDTQRAIEVAKESARQPGQQQDLNHVAADGAKRYPVDDVNAPTDKPDQLPAYQASRAAEQEVYNSVRRTPIMRGGTQVGDGQAALIAKGLLGGKYKMRDEGNGTHGIYEPGSTSPLGHIESGLAVRLGLAGSKPSGQQAALQSPVGAQAAQLAMMQSVQGAQPRQAFG